MALLEDLQPLRPEFMGAPFWFWNDDLDPAELRRQIALMHEQNVGGFYMHARMGRVTPYMSRRWMECIRACVDEAAKLGMGAWIYDEDGWPSGYGGGLVNGLGEEYLQKYARPHVLERDGTTIELPVEGGVLAVFTARRENGRLVDPQRISYEALHDNWLDTRGLTGDVVVCFSTEINNYRRHFAPECWTDGYVDVLDKKVVRAFIRKIYEPYRKQIGEQFGRAVPGVFTDEPNYHDYQWFGPEVRLPWSPVLVKEFERRYRAPLADALFDIAYGSGDAFRARWCFYSALAHCFANNYTKTLADWCAKRGLIFSGHYLLEESPRAATQTIGDPMLHYLHQQAPGTDHLGKNLDLTEFWTSARVLCKQAASIAHQFGKPRVLCETFAGGGWDFGILEQKWMGDWLYALGINLLCQHAFHYSLRGFRKRDYPPSLSYQQPWWPMSAGLGAHFARLGYALTRGERAVNVLVLHPIESFFATHDTAGYPWPEDHVNDALKRLVEELLAHQIDFDFGNEEIMRRHAEVGDGAIAIGRGRYDVVIVPYALTWRSSTLRLLKSFASAGGKLFVVEPLAEHVDANPSQRLAKLAAAATSLGRWDDKSFAARIGQDVAAAVQPALRIEAPEADRREIVHMHRRDADGEVFFLASGAKRAFSVTATFRAAGTPFTVDPETGAHTLLPGRRTCDTFIAPLDFDHGRSHLIVFPRGDEASKIAPPAGPVVEQVLCDEGDEVDYALSEPNALILDRGALIVDGEASGPMMLLEARERMKARPAGTPCRLRFTFACERPVASAWLAAETPERFAIRVNGEPVRGDQAGHFVDVALRRMRIPGGLRAGENVVEAAFSAAEDLELEPFYVLGAFGVYEADGVCRVAGLPDRLAVGSWVRQGLCFYAGQVAYRLRCAVSESADRWEVDCAALRSAARIVVNGCEAGTTAWPPYRVDVTPHLRAGANRIDVVVANSLRNFLGPHHMKGEDGIQCLGPHSFHERDRWRHGYRFKPAGLLGPVTLRGYRAG
jgi:hypothetical protein